MRRQKLLCLDIGAKIIGVAISDAFGTLALPREEIRWGGAAPALDRALSLLEEELSIGTVVVGEPQFPSPAMEEALERVVEILVGRGWTVERVDEHVSTQEAANRIADMEEETGVRFTGRRDSIAAQIILERYLASA